MRKAIIIGAVSLLVPYVAFAHTYGSNYAPGLGTATQICDLGAGFEAQKGIDGNTATLAYTCSGYPAWWKMDLGAGNKKSLGRFTIEKDTEGDETTFGVYGSDNDVSWTNIATSTSAVNTSTQEFLYNDTTAYRYYKIWATAGSGGRTYLESKEYTFQECTDCTGSTSTASSSAALSPSDMLLTYLFYIADALWWITCVGLLVGGLSWVFYFRKK